MVSVDDVLCCQFQEWYPKFKGLSLQSEIVPLPEDFVDYLMRDDGLFLPTTSQALPARCTEGEWEAHGGYETWEEGEGEEEEEPEVPSFPLLEDEINKAISRLGGAVLPKLNWSCPKDVAWISPSGSAKCSNAQEVFLLLKSSDSIVHDLCHAFDGCDSPRTDAAIRSEASASSSSSSTAAASSDPSSSLLPSSPSSASSSHSAISRPKTFVLVLRKWFDLDPSRELRCFVKNEDLIAISQREVTGFYPSLLEARDEIVRTMSAFHRQHVRGKFPRQDYTLDVYLTKKGRPKIVDFNPYGGSTLPLLFTWEEMNDKALMKDEDNRMVTSNGRGGSLGDSCEAQIRHSQEGSAGLPLAAGQQEAHCLSAFDDPCLENIELRVVECQGGVQPSMRIASGAPFDLHSSEVGVVEQLIHRMQFEGEADAHEE